MHRNEDSVGGLENLVASYFFKNPLKKIIMSAMDILAFLFKLQVC